MPRLTHEQALHWLAKRGGRWSKEETGGLTIVIADIGGIQGRANIAYGEGEPGLQNAFVAAIEELRAKLPVDR